MKFKITNTTRKEKPRNKREQVGHMIQVNLNGKLVGPGRFDYVDALTEGVIGMKRLGYCEVEEVKDDRVSLKELDEQSRVEQQMAEERRIAQVAENKNPAKVSKTGFEAEAAPIAAITDLDKKAMKETKRAADAPLTPDTAAPEADMHADAVNPDGEPNFVVSAGKGKRDGKKAADKAAQSPF